MKNIEVRNNEFYKNYSFKNYYTDYTLNDFNIYNSEKNWYELKKITSILSENKIASVLIVGLGFARELDHVLKLTVTTDIYVLDFSKNFISSAKNNYSSRVKFVLHDLNTGILPFGDNFFDLVICLNTLEYIKEDAYYKFFESSFRVLSPDGILFFRLLNKEFVFNFLDRKHQKNRDESLPRIYYRNFSETLNFVSGLFYKVDTKSKGFKIETRPLKIFYLNYLASFTIILEKILLKFISKKYARSVYFVLIKSFK